MKNYNLFALQGDTETSDVDVCRTLGLPMELAGTPKINDAAINKMHRENYDGYVRSGIDPTEALSLADSRKAEALQRVRNASKS